jgi:hypothetical protein
MIRKQLAVLGLSGLMVAGLLAGAAVTFAQTDEPAAETPSATEESTTVVPESRGGSRLRVDDEALAEALGITVEELDAAKETARLAMIDQAVADGLITEAEGEALKLEDPGFSPLAREFGYDKDEYLAEALGISVEELDAAEFDAYTALVAAAVEAGVITQEQADLLLAEKAAKAHLDEDALNAAVRAAYADALAEAVAAGDITQAQADALLAQLETQTFNFGIGGGGRHGHGHGGPGGGGGFGFNLTPDATPETTPDATDTTTDASFDA